MKKIKLPLGGWLDDSTLMNLRSTGGIVTVELCDNLSVYIEWLGEADELMSQVVQEVWLADMDEDYRERVMFVVDHEIQSNLDRTWAIGQLKDQISAVEGRISVEDVTTKLNSLKLFYPSVFLSPTFAVILGELDYWLWVFRNKLLKFGEIYES